MTGSQRAISSKTRQPRQAAAVHAGQGVALAARRARRHDRIHRRNLLNPMKKPAIRLSPFVLNTGYAYGRDSAGIPQEVVHDQRPPTPFTLRIGNFSPLQPPPTTPVE